ncbi:Ail/Lom family outer membrane beta-barrel protein [Shimwellia blattae]|uniref:Opacity protein and related surface antigen family protein n=1 Tax=Shimwellia blattae (strain ATCC 29907 / DSM 4481 / JCM 1650 / NBRC 105725 / CDC 9005-74) TaxID=630626 RepID=I2B8P1_SHIBC|nr:Ail/Lom family outer membrane beta-barrel protein [Shimwellia blattae]AFJ46895.1 opacity protein and related surface antigen family protein [Shimwellia blattae DSM 4481 = NBRC 105725]GAB82444.1 hypothetical protein EB105725_23_00570 [Shimwellia blattae DSM 4481 = NBRC 105725]VDY64380.1 Attachment invasion locus protein precursor [Shimwellia blattae]VEC22497.1 Attachment invasion locus protein precursor [Shimwellia blattae]
MNKVILAMIAGLVISAPPAGAENHTLSAGYAQGSVKGYKNVRGANFQYRYEFDYPLSLLTSVTYMRADDSSYDRLLSNYASVKTDAKYMSWQVGPALRLHEYVSAYGLLGVSRFKATGHNAWGNSASGYQVSNRYREQSTSLACASGTAPSR